MPSPQTSGGGGGGSPVDVEPPVEDPVESAQVLVLLVLLLVDPVPPSPVLLVLSPPLVPLVKSGAGRSAGGSAPVLVLSSPGRSGSGSGAGRIYTISARGVVTRCAPWDSVPKFVPPYVPIKASRVFPALKTCTSPRRAAKARQQSRRERGIITGVNPNDVRITINGREVKGFVAGDDIRVEMSVGYTAR